MESPQSLARFLEELRRRKVTRVAVTYVAVAFAGLQGLQLVLSPLGADRVYRWTVLATLAGFPAALVLAWFLELRQTRGSGSAVPAGRGSERSGWRLWNRGRAVTIGILLAAGVGLLGYRMLGPRRTVTPAAEVIAVAPFSAVGGEASSVSEGMAQLVAANLDQVGGLRTLDPTRVLRAWGRGGVTRRSEEEALALARDLGAGSVLTGSAVAVGEEVRLTSVLRAVNGREIARAQVTGRAANVLLLADSLSNRLLRGIWRAHTPIPHLRIAAITTSNLDAIRAYLEGERYYRQLHWDSAIVALRRAVELDSTFALAHRRLAEVYWWSADVDSPTRSAEEAAAARTPERLPERERAIALAYVQWESGDARGALDSLNVHLLHYPDDSEALDLKAEILLHGPGVSRSEIDDSTALEAFEAALRVDPGLTPAMIHPIGLSAAIRDSVRFRRYSTAVLGAQFHDSARVSILVDSAIGMLWERNPGYAHFARRLASDSALRWFDWAIGPLPTMIKMGADPNLAADAILTGDPEAMDTLSLGITGIGLVGAGRLKDADRVLGVLGRRNPVMAARMRTIAVAFGIAGREFVGASTTGAIPRGPGENAALAAVREAALDLAAGDTTGARTALARVPASSGSLPPAVEALRRFDVARLRTFRGDLRGGLADMEAALRTAESAPPSPVAPPPLFYKVFLAIGRSQYAPTRRQGIEELRRFQFVPLIPLVRIYLAQALEAEGQRAAAKQEYAGFLRTTGRAEGNLARLHQEAQAALVRLTRER